MNRRELFKSGSILAAGAVLPAPVVAAVDTISVHFFDGVTCVFDGSCWHLLSGVGEYCCFDMAADGWAVPLAEIIGDAE